MRIILIDDEKLSLEQMEHILESYDDIERMGSYTDPLTALEKIKIIKPDVVMLDISMPEMNGFQIAWEIMNISPDTMIIFVTAYDQYALKAFDVEAIDYILKPISKRRMEKAIRLIRKRLQTKEKSTLNSFDTSQIKQFNNRIPVWENESVVLIDVQAICYCVVMDKKTTIYTYEKEYISNDTLVQLEERLSQQFFRCHKSFLVNLQKIDKIIPMFNQTFIIKLKELKIEIPVSRHYSKQLREIFGF